MFNRIKNIFNKAKKGGCSCSGRKTVLVVDDSEIDRKLVLSAVMDAGCQFITGVNGAEGLELARNRQPDLILLDCEMPVMTGQEMFAQLREDETTQNIPVIFLTGVDTPRNILECFDASAENYLNKPVNPKQLAAQLRDFFKR